MTDTPSNSAKANLRAESLMRWHLGDWSYLCELDEQSIAQHPDKALLATLKSAALFQQGDMSSARELAKQAQDWGGEHKMLERTFLSGVQNSLGRAAMLAGMEQRAAGHILQAMRAAEVELDGALLYPARLMQQKRQIKAKAHPNSTHGEQAKPAAKPSDEQLQEQQQQIRLKLNQAKKARTENNYQLAEQLLTEILQLDPNQPCALKERARLTSAQQQWNAATEDYTRLLKTQSETESAILARSLMKKNSDLLEEAIADLEHAKALGFYNSQIAHQLALAYRDNQQWQEAEQTVRDLLIQDPAYLHTMSFATFVADLLRKRKKVQEACVLLSTVVEQAQADGKEIPLNTQAILQELQYAAGQADCSPEVSRHYYDTIYAQSEKYQADPEHSAYLPVWEKVVGILKQDGVKQVLDIGCGPGQFAEYLIKNIPGINYTGVDYSQTAIETGRLRCPTAQFYVKDLMQEGALEEFQADVFIILEVLEHINQDLELIARIPGGQKVIFSVPNMDSFGHVRFFKDTQAVLKRYGECMASLVNETVVLAGRSKIHLANAIMKF